MPRYHRITDPDGYPGEQAADLLTRKDDLLLLILKRLEAMSGTGGGGGTTPPINITAPTAIAKKLTITTIPLGAVNTERRFQFPVGTKQLTFHARNGNAVRIASEPGKVVGSNDPYFTLKANTVFCTDNFVIPENNVVTWYFSCAVASEVIEMVIGD